MSGVDRQQGVDPHWLTPVMVTRSEGPVQRMHLANVAVKDRGRLRAGLQL